LITDVSSVALGLLGDRKPMAIVAIQQKGAAFRQAIPMARVAYVIESDLSTLPKALDELLGRTPWPRNVGPIARTVWGCISDRTRR
jgi:hypothetical protein